MKIAATETRWKHEDMFIQNIYLTALELGHKQASVTDADLLIQWGARPKRNLPTLYCELGWLPRWRYQVSHTGINAEHHLARPKLQALTKEQKWKVDLIVKDAREGKGMVREWGYLHRGPMEHPPTEPFILAPLQMPDDVNMDSIAPELRSNQGFIDHVSEADLPYVTLFKCHPNTLFAELGPIITRREQDRIWPHSRGSVYQLLETGLCRAVIARNSNVLHDALLYDVPAVALSDGIWPRGKAVFGDSMSLRYFAGFCSEWYTRESTERLRSYIHAIDAMQWTLETAADPQRVEAAIEGATK